MCPILQNLANPDSTSCLTTLEYEPTRDGDLLRDKKESRQSMAEALGQYLKSTSSASLRNLDLKSVHFSCRSGSLILDGLSQNMSVNHLGLFDCCIGSLEEQSSEVERIRTQQLADFFQQAPPSLRISKCNFFEHQVILNALVENLTKQESPLRCFDISCDQGFEKKTEFQSQLYGLCCLLCQRAVHWRSLQFRTLIILAKRTIFRLSMKRFQCSKSPNSLSRLIFQSTRPCRSSSLQLSNAITLSRHCLSGTYTILPRCILTMQIKLGWNST